MRFNWISSPGETVNKRSCLRNQNFILSSFLSWLRLTNAVRKCKIPEECCFLFRICTNANSGAIVKSPGGSLPYVMSHQFWFPPITKENERTCLGLFCHNKVLFIQEKRPFFRMIELTPSSLFSQINSWRYAVIVLEKQRSLRSELCNGDVACLFGLKKIAPG